LTDNPGFYTSGDAGFFDENGFLHIMTRLDDVFPFLKLFFKIKQNKLKKIIILNKIINTAGHRLSTA